METARVTEEIDRLAEQEERASAQVQQLNARLLRARTRLDAATAADERAEAVLAELSAALQQLGEETEAAEKERALHGRSHDAATAAAASARLVTAKASHTAAHLHSTALSRHSRQPSGSVLEVTQKVAAGELSSAIALVRPPGHHAEHDKAMGFCLFNNVAVAANYLLNERVGAVLLLLEHVGITDLGIKKILIVDWDVHHGNATQKMFYDDPRVLSFSVHRFDYGTFYPDEADGSHCFIGEEMGRGYNINVPWEHGSVVMQIILLHGTMYYFLSLKLLILI
ncbi:histone deacetylase 5-like [Miscanthus floridulus]|uniref:histone deacetylase 5-like n=1 Tax=Miscanthus floridulus TaxID=154761 RepID=UPI003459C756